MSWITNLLKTLLPFLMTAAEKAVKKLPKESQDKLTQISKMVEVIKQALKSEKTLTSEDVANLILKNTGLDKQQAFDLLLIYLKQKGQEAKSFEDALLIIWNDAESRTETGLKSLWMGIVNILGEVVANIDWKVLLLGIVQAIFTNNVKGKVKL